MAEWHTSAMGGDTRKRGAAWDEAFAAVVADLGAGAGCLSSTEPALPEPLRCVSSGYLEHGCSCTARVPGGVAVAAWRRVLGSAGARADGFFRFAWRGEVWLAYGLIDGCVRGVYCPEHSAQRERRAFAAMLHAVA